MKLLLTLLIPFILCTTIFGQSISYDDFKALLPGLEKEDFKNTFQKTSQLLAATTNDSSQFRAIIIYMNIFSAAGMVTLGQMTHAGFSKNANQYIGQQVIMAAYPCIDSGKFAFNSLHLVTKNGELQGSAASSNKSNTAIFCFEEFKYGAAINPAAFIGQTVRCGGTLSTIEMNPNNSKVWIARLFVTNAFARVITAR